MWPVLLHWGYFGTPLPDVNINICSKCIGSYTRSNYGPYPLDFAFGIVPSISKRKKKIKYIVNLFISDQLYLKH